VKKHGLMKYLKNK